MTSEFGPDMVKELIAAKEKDEAARKEAQRQEELSQLAEKQRRQAEEKRVHNEKREKKLEKEHKRWEKRIEFIDTMIDWFLEDLSEQIKNGSVRPVVKDNKTVLEFVLPEAWHELTGEMRNALFVRLSHKLGDEWDSVDNRAEIACNPCADRMSQLDERYVGRRYTLIKRN